MANTETPECMGVYLGALLAATDAVEAFRHTNDPAYALRAWAQWRRVLSVRAKVLAWHASGGGGLISMPDLEENVYAALDAAAAVAKPTRRALSRARNAAAVAQMEMILRPSFPPDEQDWLGNQGVTSREQLYRAMSRLYGGTVPSVRKAWISHLGATGQTDGEIDAIARLKARRKTAAAGKKTPAKSPSATAAPAPPHNWRKTQRRK